MADNQLVITAVGPIIIIFLRTGSHNRAERGRPSQERGAGKYCRKDWRMTMTLRPKAHNAHARPDFLFLKHDSSFLRQAYNPVCGFSMMEQVRLCAVWPTGELAWLFQGWMTV